MDPTTFKQEDIDRIIYVKTLYRAAYADFITALWQRPTVASMMLTALDKCTFVSGGSFSTFFLGEDNSERDIDFYFTTANDCNAFKKVIEHRLVMWEASNQYGNASSISDEPNAWTLRGTNFQLVTNDHLIGAPDIVRRSFDLEHCKPYYDPSTDKLYVSPLQLLLIKNKWLVKNIDALKGGFINHPVKDFRIAKYENRGWTPAPDSFYNDVLQPSKRGSKSTSSI